MNSLVQLILIGIFLAAFSLEFATASPSDFSKKGKTTMKDIPTEEKPKKELTKMQHYVTRKDGTEPPFKNEYWDNKEAGVYVDVISGKPLFSSKDKFDSGTGWPSFTQPIDQAEIVEKTDRKLFVSRTEVRGKESDAHLGHVFKDGPKPSGLRYCINSAALDFIPLKELEQRGYSELKNLFLDPKSPQ